MDIKLKHIRKTFEKTRKRLAQKLGNPQIIRIQMKTFRHWKAMREYHKTKDILHVKRLLGHKNIQNTLIYTQLVNFESDEFVCKVANSLKKCTELLETGFEYITDYGDRKIFRK